MATNHAPEQRLHALDALRGFALLLGVAFHAALSFMPGWPPGLWAMNDVSPSAALSDAAFVTHIFRMSLFFFLAGFFARLLHQRVGTRAFWANRGKRIAAPLVLGWIVVFPAIAFVWTVGIAKVFGGHVPQAAATPALPGVAGAFPLTHLWFLYQLLLIYAAFLGARAVCGLFQPAQCIRSLMDRAITSGIGSGVAVFTLGIPTAAALMTVPMWFYWTGIPTPDQTLTPQLPASVAFGTAFFVGWIVHRTAGALPALTQRWWVHLSVAVLVTGILLVVMHRHPLAEPGFTKNVFAYLFGVAVWAWVFGLTGASLRFLSNYSPGRRYVADASYWIYIVHLPVVVALQVWVGHWPLHWSIKYPIVLVGSLAALFASYHLLVRSTFIGRWLNGRKLPCRPVRVTPPGVAVSG